MRELDMSDRDDSERTSQEDQRQPYEPPKVTDFGTLSGLTFGNGSTGKDGDFTGS